MAAVVGPVRTVAALHAVIQDMTDTAEQAHHAVGGRAWTPYQVALHQAEQQGRVNFGRVALILIRELEAVQAFEQATGKREPPRGLVTGQNNLDG